MMGMYFSKDRPYYRTEIKPIKMRTCYQVGNILYKTPAAAAKKMAWSWIFTKYGGMQNRQHPSIHDIKKLLWMICECNNNDDSFGGYQSDGCEIHDRINGYFKRLHKRTVNKILQSWEAGR
jgi:hypothetical protein